MEECNITDPTMRLEYQPLPGWVNITVCHVALPNSIIRRFPAFTTDCRYVHSIVQCTKYRLHTCWTFNHHSDRGALNFIS